MKFYSTMTMLQLMILLSTIDMAWPFTRQDERDEICNRYPDYCG